MNNQFHSTNVLLELLLRYHCLSMALWPDNLEVKEIIYVLTMIGACSWFAYGSLCCRLSLCWMLWLFPCLSWPLDILLASGPAAGESAVYVLDITRAHLSSVVYLPPSWILLTLEILNLITTTSKWSWLRLFIWKCLLRATSFFSMISPREAHWLSLLLSFEIPSEAHGNFWLFSMPSESHNQQTVSGRLDMLYKVLSQLHSPSVSIEPLPTLLYESPQNLCSCFQHAPIDYYLKHLEFWPRERIKVILVWSFVLPFSFLEELLYFLFLFGKIFPHLNLQFFLPLRASYLRHYLSLNYWFNGQEVLGQHLKNENFLKYISLVFLNILCLL